LIHQTEDGETLMEKDVFKMDTYRAWVRKYYNQQDELRKHKERVRERESEVVEKDVRVGSFVDRMNRLITKMDKPALFFVFSRKMCEEYASKVSANLLTSSEGAEVHHIVKYHLHRYDLQKIESYHVLLALLTKGVAFHHSGMLPILKEIVEILFDKGFVKVLFATETFAVGINMPTKTVVFTSYRKVGEVSRMLRTSEYIQMAGRAGRRGKDDKGIVIYLPIREPEEPELVREMMCGRTATIESQMKFDYSYILATIGSGTNIQNQTYWSLQHQQEYDGYVEDIKELNKKIEHVKIEETFLKECAKKQELKTLIKKTGNAEKKKAEKELSQWDNSHMGPKWVVAWKSFSEISVLKSQIDLAEYHLEKLDAPFYEIKQRTKFLETHGFLTCDPPSLTKKGELASLIHEGHPILMTELYTRNLLKDESAEQIVAILSCFLEEPHTEEIIPETKYVKKIREMKVIPPLSELCDEPEYWDVTDYWVEVVLDWLEYDFVCEKYGIEHGNFVRAMLKLANILREWVSMATLSQDTEMIEKLKDMETKLIRGFVIPDSLYLRI
jgi:superfamily II RNA helicase